METDITSIRIKEDTRDKFNLVKLTDKFRSADEFINFLLNLYENNKKLVERTNNKTHVEQIEQKGLNTKKPF